MLPGKNNYFIHYVSGLPWIVYVYEPYSTLYWRASQNICSLPKTTNNKSLLYGNAKKK